MTCSRITEYGPSATSLAISTPRFIGPGCMMMTSSAAPASRALVRPKSSKYSLIEGIAIRPCRSSWMRSIMITSAPRTASASVWATSTPSRSMPTGIMVRGPATVTRAPILVSRWMFERTTRLCSMSPTIATLRPARRPLWRRMV